MRAIFVLRSVAIYGGVERVVVDKMNYLAAQGHEVTLVTYEQGGHPLSFPLNSGVKHIDLDIRFFTLSKVPFYFRIWKL